MIKNVLIGFLILTSVFFIVYANIKAKEVEKVTLMAEMNLKLAQENEARAKAEEQKAVEAAALARIEARKTEELASQLEKCRK